MEVLDGSPVSEVAVRYGVSRQSVYSWRDRYAAGGIDGLRDVSRRPKTSPSRLPAEVEALVCELRRAHPRWGARRIAFEVAQRGVERAPSRATVHRVLERNGLVVPQAQRHKRKYKRWQRETPMALWQLDLVGGIYLADGRECKLLSGIDDHSRFVVCAAVLAVPSGRAVADAFTAAMRTYGVPSEVLTDIQAFHRPVHQAQAGGGAVRAGLPRARHHRQADRPVLADHDREGGTLASHAAP
jgi:transposase